MKKTGKHSLFSLCIVLQQAVLVGRHKRVLYISVALCGTIYYASCRSISLYVLLADFHILCGYPRDLLVKKINCSKPHG